jgi:DNA-binding NtrC family response regulator
MIQRQGTNPVQQEKQIRRRPSGRFDFAPAPLAGRRQVRLNGVAALVASSDPKVLQALAKTTVQCGLTAFPAYSVSESKAVLSRSDVGLVVCEDRFADGSYEDILCAATNIPVIVVSRTGDWLGCVKAIDAGAFDFVAYPEISGSIQRAVRDALAWQDTGGEEPSAVEPVPEKMRKGGRTVLLAGHTVTRSAMLRRQLREWSCQCRFAASFEQACRLLSQEDFDLVLCQYDLPDRTAFPLLDWLEGSTSTLVFCAGSGSGSRWLPVIRHGERYFERAPLSMKDLLNHLANAAVSSNIPQKSIRPAEEEVTQILAS